MPNSIKCKIKRLCYNGTITERECDRILKALEHEQHKKAKWIDVEYWQGVVIAVAKTMNTQSIIIALIVELRWKAR